MKEYIRTIILLIVLGVLLGYLYYYQQQSTQDLVGPQPSASQRHHTP